MKAQLASLLAVPFLFVSCAHKAVVGPIDLEPIHTEEVTAAPAKQSVKRTQESLHNVRLQIASANAEAQHAQSQAVKAKGMLKSYGTLVDELSKSNNILSAKFRELGEAYKALEEDRKLTIEKLQANVDASDKLLTEAEERADIAYERLDKLENALVAKNMEVANLRARGKRLVDAIRVTEQQRVDDVNKARKELSKYRSEYAKYKGYYDICIKVMWFIGFLVVIGIILFYIRNFTPAGRASKLL